MMTLILKLSIKSIFNYTISNSFKNILKIIQHIVVFI